MKKAIHKLKKIIKKILKLTNKIIKTFFDIYNNVKIFLFYFNYKKKFKKKKYFLIKLTYFLLNLIN